jgi:hypothetical protein
MPPQLLLKIDEIDGDEAAKAARKALVGSVNESTDRSGRDRGAWREFRVMGGPRKG